MNKLFYLLMVLLLVPTAIAGSFSTHIENVKQNIYLNQTAEFKLKIDNQLGFDDVFDIDVGNNPDWSVSANPTVALTSEFGINIPKDDNREIRLLFKPLSRVSTGWHLLELTTRSKKSNQIIKGIISIYVRQTGEFVGKYLPSFSIELEAPEEVDPRDDLKVNVILENRNYLNITKIYVKVTGDDIVRDFTTNLPPMRRKTQTFTVNLDDVMDPQTIKLDSFATVETANRSFTAHSDSITVNVKGYSDLKRTKVTEKEFLRSKEFITLTNDGNVRNSGEVKLETSFFQRIFTRSTPVATLVEEGNKNYLKWEFTLAPQETSVLVVTKNYRPLVIIIVLLIILVGAYYLFRSPITITKSATRIIRKGKDPNFTELKILLLVKNRSAKQISNMTIIDKIPRIAEVEKEFQIGTLAPTKITKHDKRGTNVYWDLQSLDPFEERIITYRIRSKLTIVGGITLPVATVKFSSGKREMLIHSGRTNVNI